MDTRNYLTTDQAAAALGVGLARVKALCRSGRLCSRLFLGRLLITRASVDSYASSPRKPGRPRKTG